MKIAIRIAIASSILGIAAFALIQVPSIQDRIMASVVSGMINATDNLPKEDALSAAVCGSRSPIPSPGRAETCMIVQAGEEMFVVDIGDGGNANLQKWRIDYGAIKAVLLKLKIEPVCKTPQRIVCSPIKSDLTSATKEDSNTPAR